ncbi:methylenetetrahydrofolate reductase [Oerskovia sp. M15]
MTEAIFRAPLGPTALCGAPAPSAPRPQQATDEHRRPGALRARGTASHGVVRAHAPRRPDAAPKFWETARRLVATSPDFVSVTYGAAARTARPRAASSASSCTAPRCCPSRT